MATDQNDTKPSQNPDQEHNANSEKSNSSHTQNADTQPTSQQLQAEQNQQPQQQLQGQSKGQNRRRFRGKGRGWNHNRDRDVLYEKAIKLAQSGRVEFLDNGVYNVIGDHGTYTVALDHTGKLSCNCPGFIQKGVCSHVTAVSLVTRNRHRR